MKPPTYVSHRKPRCLLSDPAQPHQLQRRNFSELTTCCYICKGNELEESKYHYYCDTCDLEFHRGCHKFPPQIKHPAHISHLLTFVSSDPKINTSNLPYIWIDDETSGSESSINEYDDYEDDVLSNEKCKCCGRFLGKLYYQCYICNFKLKAECATAPPPLNVLHKKSHEHTLTLFPRRLPLPCDACGESLEDIKDLVYACLPCNYMVHSRCVYLPHVIKITRHQHRLSYTSSLSSGDHGLSCGVCRKSVDINCGQYSCSKGCQYAVHSKCATRWDVWDGKDLEGVPEEPEEDVEPFVRIDEETIQHFSHEQHYIKLYKNIDISICGETKYCEACCLAIPNSKDFYSCMECDFILDEECASLPRKMNHPLHKHPLTLHPIALNPFDFFSMLVFQGMFDCSGCYRECFGFVYECSKKDCDFQLDVRCASLPDPLIHGCHQQDHPLFFNLTKGKCMSCKSTNCSSYYLECMQCKSFLGVKCASLPSLAHYKHDRHPFTLHYGEKGTRKDEYWCEICESKVDAETWFYTCELCRVTLHVNCLLEEDVYMKLRHVFKTHYYEEVDVSSYRGYKVFKTDDYVEVEIVSNSGNSRPFCSQCHKRCQKGLIFVKGGDNYLCSWNCLVQILIQKK